MLKRFVNDWNVKISNFRLNLRYNWFTSVSLDFLLVFLWHITLDPNGVKYWHSSLIDDSPKKR